MYIPKISAHRRYFNKTKFMSYLIKYKKLLEKCNEIWKKSQQHYQKEFNIKPVYNEKYLKTKIKPYDGKINTIFTIIKYQKKALNVFVYQ